MTTTAATSSISATSTSPSDDSPTVHDNAVAPSETATYENNRRQNDQQHNHHQISLSNLQQRDDSKILNKSDDPKQHTQNPPVTQALASVNNAAVTASPTTSSASSSSSSTPPPSASPATNEGSVDVKQEQSPSPQHQSNIINANSNVNTEQKRPMNAFLLFCKTQRSLVREKYPNLENRGITKILGDEWTKLDKEQKSKYTDLARQHKEAFMKANPDFKWCKTTNVSNLNNNSSNNSTSANDNCTNNQNNEHKHSQHHNPLPNHLHPQQRSQQPQNNYLYNQQNQLHQNHHYSPHLAPNVELLSLHSMQNHADVMHHQSSNSMDISLTSRQQLEAPKPPKKRFLERNDSIYTSKNNSSTSRHDANLHGTDIVPCISLDQDTLDRVIDKAFSEESSSSKNSGNSCKCSNRNPTNVTISLSNNQTSFPTTTTANSSSTSYPMNIDEPVDFSMNRTINTTRQQIINNLVEKMLSESSDDASSNVSKLNGSDSSSKGFAGPPVKKDKSDPT